LEYKTARFCTELTIVT